MKTNVFSLKNNIIYLLLALVIFLHWFLRFSEMPYSYHVLSEYTWRAPLNYAAGKEFTDRQNYLNSPELKEFMNFKFNAFDKERSISDTVHEFQDYKDDGKPIFIFWDSIGYRYMLGVIWKVFGINWYYVGVFNYILSLLGLLSLMYCSYRILGPSYSFMIGLIYSLSYVDVNYVVKFGRDGIPLWFASYLICGLILFFNKSITLKRLTLYPILFGAITFMSVQGRSSCIYFLPLLLSIYFLIFFFYTDEKLQFRYSYLLKSNFSHKLFMFLYASLITVGVALSLNQMFFYIFLSDLGSPTSAMMHVIFLGLGVPYFAPFSHIPITYKDYNVTYLAGEYGKRMFDYDNVGIFTEHYDSVLQKLYLSIVKTYPYFYVFTLLRISFFESLFYLGHPVYIFQRLFSAPLKTITHYIDKLPIFPYLFFGSAIGAFALYFKMNQKKIAVILTSFIFFNAGVSFLQYNFRHLLLGHPAYYFLTGIALVFLFNALIKFIKNTNFRFNMKSIVEFKHVVINYGSHFLKSRKLIYSVAILIMAFISVKVLKFYLIRVENHNVKVANTYFNNLQKNEIKFDPSSTIVPLPNDLVSHSLGVYCVLGEVKERVKMDVKVAIDKGSSVEPFYNIKLTGEPGKNVILFIPFFYYSEKTFVELPQIKQCKSLMWSDLRDWKGPLQIGSYDTEKLMD